MLAFALGDHLGGRTEPFDRHHLAHVLGVDPGVLQADRSAERVADDRERSELLLVHELGDVVDVVDQGVAGPDHPLGVTVAPKIRRDDVVFAAQRLRDPVPVAAVVAPSVNEQQWGRVLVSPGDVVKPEALREVTVRGGARNGILHADIVADRGRIGVQPCATEDR